uniref:Elongation factor 1-gamma n=1 Tax=Cucumis sativus TaxID=3659 RepID=A0A0A0L2P8_CUCSA
MALVLHSWKTNKNAYKALIAAEYNGVKVDLSQDFTMGVTNKSPEYLKMNPIGKVPVLETPDGAIFESNAIARYVARLKDSGLFGSSSIDCGHVEQWIDFSTFEIDIPVSTKLRPRFGYAAFHPGVEETADAALKRSFGALNSYLASNTFLVGHSVTLADIILTCNLYLGFNYILTKSFTSEFPHVERYFWTLVNQPNFKKIMGEVKQTDAVPPVKTPEEAAAAAKAKAEPKKQEEKPAAPAEEEAPKPKAKNPLDLLPPSSMILDEWKCLYSNTKSNFREVAIKGFWDMYDPEGYSLWFCDYKYNDENTVSFVTLNKVGGFLQRMDIARNVLDECYDMELYEWKKVDISDEAQKERVSQMIEDQEPFEGEALLDAKCFK